MIYEDTNNGGKKLAVNSAHAAGAIVVLAILALAGIRYFFVD